MWKTEGCNCGSEVAIHAQKCGDAAHRALRAERDRACAALTLAEAKIDYLESYAYNHIALAAELMKEREELHAEIESVMEHMPQDCVVRVREGNGPEDLAASLSVSVSKLAQKR